MGTTLILVIVAICVFWGFFSRILKTAFKIISRLVLAFIVIAIIYKYNQKNVYEELPKDLSKEKVNKVISDVKEQYEKVKPDTIPYIKIK